MPSLNAGAIEACLTGKLCAERAGGDHRTFRVLDDAGTLVGRAKLSHSWHSTTPVSSGMVQSICRQLGLERSSDLVELVRCTLTRQQYLAIASRS